MTRRGRRQVIRPESYRLNMLALAERLGEYCSYCEVPLAANLAIEHVLPKSVNPNAEEDWNNFLLACTNCNSTKGTNVRDVRAYCFPHIDNTFEAFAYYEKDRLCWVAPTDTANRDRAERTINLLQLNRYDGTTTGTVSDRRVRNRTEAAYKAGKLVDRSGVPVPLHPTVRGSAARGEPSLQRLSHLK
jgi:hypothetical protein